MALRNELAAVAEDGFEPLLDGKDHVYAGSLKTKLQGIAARLSPRRLTTRMHRRMNEPQGPRQ